MGAQTLCRAAAGALPRLAERHSFRAVVQSGAAEYESTRRALEGLAPEVEVKEFLDDMPARMEAADLIVARAGAMTLAEICALGRPAVLVPFPHATDDHQTANALSLARAGAARLIPDAELDGARLLAELETLLGDKEDLAAMAPEWTLVVGVGRGHDGAGILAALEPVTGRVWLTTSEHPKALDPRELAAAAPVLDGHSVEVAPDCRIALTQALESAGEDGWICVTGSLHLVARAREFLDLPMERDGITEDVALESLTCLKQACARLGLACRAVSADGNVVRVSRGGHGLHFMRNKNPFKTTGCTRSPLELCSCVSVFGDSGLDALINPAYLFEETCLLCRHLCA